MGASSPPSSQPEKPATALRKIYRIAEVENNPLCCSNADHVRDEFASDRFCAKFAPLVVIVLKFRVSGCKPTGLDLPHFGLGLLGGLEMRGGFVGEAGVG